MNNHCISWGRYFQMNALMSLKKEAEKYHLCAFFLAKTLLLRTPEQQPWSFLINVVTMSSRFSSSRARLPARKKIWDQCYKHVDYLKRLSPQVIIIFPKWNIVLQTHASYLGKLLYSKKNILTKAKEQHSYHMVGSLVSKASNKYLTD